MVIVVSTIILIICFIDSCYRFIIKSIFYSFIFGYIQNRLGNISDKEYDILKEYFDVIGFMPDRIIYLNTFTSTAFSRIRNRNRQYERNINYGDLKTLRTVYDDMVMKNWPNSLSVIDGNQDETRVYDDVLYDLEMIIKQ